MKCVSAGGGVFIDGHLVAQLLEDDSRGRPLAHWSACRTLNAQELFLLSTYSRFSFDSRYFGPVKRVAVLGRAIPLWTLVMRANAHAACVVGLLLMNTVAAADRPVYCDTERWRSLIAEAGTRFEIPQVWLHAVIRAESAGCELIDGHPITSAAGAMGLMQLMPATWNEYRERLTLGNESLQPARQHFGGRRVPA